MSTALYRRYRPDVFAEVIGQEHVTEPLENALNKNRVNHAYLFSGPRGCGKTTSARILARCLNCVQGPTATPCGECASCVDLRTGGPGSLDVIEIDAASHGGVDDARDLRERATFAPTRDRYKIFIVDEAHMVTSAGFNALLKIVEEPPEHVKFIFATTEPDKVIGTIRSRTHHYPFRLVPPEPLMHYLEQLATSEQVAIAPGVLSLVVRAGGGSVRDTLSVLDQLIAGATAEGVSYDLAVNLLGFTPENLLDDVIEALAAADSASVFRVVDRVVQSGQDPRRFVEDLLERFRDVVIVKAAPAEAHAILHGTAENQLRRLQVQAEQLGAAEVSRYADVTAAALTEMVGATSPQLHLELLMARLMLPSTDETERGLAARLDRIERRLDYGGTPVASTPGVSAQGPSEGQALGSASSQDSATGGSAPSVPDASGTGLSGADLARAALRSSQTQDSQSPRAEAPTPSVEVEAPTRPGQAETPAPTLQPAQSSPTQAQDSAQVQDPAQTQALAPPSPATKSPAPESPAPGDPASEGHAQSQPPSPEAPAQSQSPAPEASWTEQPAQTQQGPPGGQTQPAQSSQLDMVRRSWPEVITYLESKSRLIWMTVKANAQILGYDGQLLTIGFSNDGARNTVVNRGGEQLLSMAFNEVIGIQPRLDLVSGAQPPADGGDGDPKASSRPQPAAPQTPAPGPTQQQPNAPSPPQQQPATETPTQQHLAEQPPAPPEPVAQQPPATETSANEAPTSTPATSETSAQGVQAPEPATPWAESTPPTPADQPVDQRLVQQPVEQPAAQQPKEQRAEQSTEHDPARPLVVEEPPPAWDEEIPEEPEPIADDGFAGFIPRPLPGETPQVPAFAKSEAELRAEFERRFGDTIPGTGSEPTSTAKSSAELLASSAPANSASSGALSSDLSTSGTQPQQSRSDQPSAPDNRGSEQQPGQAQQTNPTETLSASQSDQTGRADGNAQAFSSSDSTSPTPRSTAETFQPRPNSRFAQLRAEYLGEPAPEPADNSTDNSSSPANNSAGITPASTTPDTSTGGTPDQPGTTTPPTSEQLSPLESARVRVNAAKTHNSQQPATQPKSVAWEDEYASDDDIMIEDSGLAGRVVVEKLLNARLIEELNPDGSPKI